MNPAEIPDAALAAAPSSSLPALRPLRIGAPLRWLAAGWRDFRRCPGIGLFYGACFVAMGWLLLAVFEHAPAWTLALSAGFLLVGPFLGLGLYRASQVLEDGGRPLFVDTLLAWRARGGAMAIFGFVLLVLEMVWGRATLVLFAISFDGMPDFRGSLLALLDPANLGFTLGWVALGAVFASLIFAISAVSIPMILHRRTDAVSAALTSLRLVLGQPLVMAAWAGLIVAVVGLAMLPGFLGLLVAGPVIGHASWHAYREAVAG